MTDELLRVENISKSFSGVQALQDVSFSIQRGEIRCLVGENGSGKSTLIKIIAGVYTRDSGEIYINGKQYQHLEPIDAIHEGIQVIYQDFSLFPNLTVAENIALNYQLARNNRLVKWGEVKDIAREALSRINVNVDLGARVDEIAVADRQLVAISRALLQDAQLIIMDEPTTALTQKEVRSLFEVIKNLQSKGIATLFVSHKLSEVLEISETAMILRNGKKVADGPTSDFDHASMVYHMTGREIDESAYTYAPTEDRTPLLRVENLSLAGAFSNVSFELMPGEILGITGLLGSGRTELAQALFGVEPADAGAIFVDGRQVRIRSIQDALAQSIGYVPEDRLTKGLFLERSVGNNIIVRIVDTVADALGLIDRRERNEEVDRWIDELAIKTPSPELPAQSLSGGNQQRVVLAKWLAAEPRILILNGPTVGVDVGSKSELHELIRTLAREQKIGILVVSDDIPELLATCNRILLMRQGHIVNELDAATTTQNELDALLRKSNGQTPASSNSIED